MDASDDAWEFLAEVVVARRLRLGLKQTDLADYGGPKKTTVSKVEGARQRSFPLRTQHQLAKALGWEPDAIRQILECAGQAYFNDQRDCIVAQYVDAPVPDLSESRPVSRASELTDAELLAELGHRLQLRKDDQGEMGNGEHPASTSERQYPRVVEDAARTDPE